MRYKVQVEVTAAATAAAAAAAAAAAQCPAACRQGSPAGTRVGVAREEACAAACSGLVRAVFARVLASQPCTAATTAPRTAAHVSSDAQLVTAGEQPGCADLQRAALPAGEREQQLQQQLSEAGRENAALHSRLGKDTAWVSARATIDANSLALVLIDPDGVRYGSAIALPVLGDTVTTGGPAKPGTWRVTVRGVGSVSGVALDPAGVTNGYGAPGTITGTTYNRVQPAPSPASHPHPPTPPVTAATISGSGSGSSATPPPPPPWRGSAGKTFLSAMYAARRSSLPSAPPSHTLPSSHASLDPDAPSNNDPLRLLPGGISPRSSPRRSSHAMVASVGPGPFVCASEHRLSPARNRDSAWPARNSGPTETEVMPFDMDPGGVSQAADQAAERLEDCDGSRVGRSSSGPPQHGWTGSALYSAERGQGAQASGKRGFGAVVAHAASVCARSDRRAASTDLPAGVWRGGGGGGRSFGGPVRQPAQGLRSSVGDRYLASDAISEDEESMPQTDDDGGGCLVTAHAFRDMGPSAAGWGVRGWTVGGWRVVQVWIQARRADGQRETQARASFLDRQADTDELQGFLRPTRTDFGELW
ncbi:MAG: hypothetical protein WDW38_011549 [Sanguina aurantia]